MSIWIISFVSGFLCGSVPWGYILVKKFKHTDIRNYGSGNIGATNVWRTYGRRLGLSTFVLDAIKGIIPVFLFKTYFGINFAISAGMGAILGHAFTPWLKFRGGKGVTTGIGVFAILAPIEAIIVFCIWGLIRFTCRRVSVASMGASACLVVLIFLRNSFSSLFFFTLCMFLCIIFFHRSNIRRLIRGEEPRA
jgi:glycerol-3-phosphate acyltransferase PlsY